MTASKVGERLSERPAPEVARYLAGARMYDDRDHSFGYLTAVNRAHVVMLAHKGILKSDVVKALLTTIDAITEGGADQLPLDDEREDLFFNYEHEVIERTSHEVGGQMHTGRSRNDLWSTVVRLRCRDVVLGLVDAVIELRAALLERAAATADVLLPGYTHLQPAQPITVGHYLTAIEGALDRDTERLLGALQRTNLSPLGAAALAGTGFPIDRDQTAHFLGFEGLITNTLDSVASRDYLVETLGAGSILGVTLSRFAQDLFIWFTAEFGMVDFRDRIAGTSSIMPQKKNPVVLETIKGRTSHAIGAFATAAATIHSSNYTNLIDANREGLSPAWSALEDLRVSVILTRLAVDNMSFREELMAQRCRENFSTVTQLADALVTSCGLSFRQAHEVVGGVVRQAVDRGLRATEIDAALVRTVGKEVVEQDLDVSEELVRQSLDPDYNVRVRSHTGGPAPDEVRRMATAAEERLESARAEVAEVRTKIDEGARDLEMQVRALLN